MKPPPRGPRNAYRPRRPGSRRLRWRLLAAAAIAVLAAAAATTAVAADGPAPGRPDDRPPPVGGAASLRLAECGAILAEDFEGARLDRARWRVWQENPGQTAVRQEKGRLQLDGRGQLGHNGLWGLTTAKYKDVLLVGEMDIRSRGPGPHRLALHLCGGDGTRSPDHWVEIDLVDRWEKARFTAMAALPLGYERHQDRFLELPHPADRHPAVPGVINDPHSAWHAVLMADALVKAGGKAVCRVGPDVGKGREADNTAVVEFRRQQLIPRQDPPRCGLPCRVRPAHSPRPVLHVGSRVAGRAAARDAVRRPLPTLRRARAGRPRSPRV